MSNNQTYTSNLICTIDPCKFLRIKEHPDGSITRLQRFPSTPACNDLNSPFPVLSKDVPLNPNNKTSLRLFLPKVALQNPKTSSKLPIIVYFHGGGLVFHHTNSTVFHNFCMKLSSATTSLVVSVDYRLAPEHRLPATFEDGLETLQWISASYHDKKSSTSHDDRNWITNYGDSSNCYIMGSSAGGLVAYKVGLRASTTMFVETCNPLIIKGLILHSPSFDGQNCTRSEVHHVNDRRVPSTVFDFFVRKSLPIEAERGHDYLNIREGLEDGILDRVRELGLQVLLKGGSKDPFVDRQIELIKLLGENGVIVTSDFTPGDFHVPEYTHAQKFDRFLVVIRDFISSCMSSTNGHPNPKTLKPNL